ncbi:hypothetical protein J1605_013490 [Eschrichtius robustus]|uniref:Uncharacterized protein n=1 Tax=Eschrichtius robustus TaxID=9764 RepID=A0AB34GI93_ESCRO|nr:hypothetical protein J1605_013490 [Eschrichtius robustus]
MKISCHATTRRDLNYNQLHEFPVAIRTLGRLQELGFHNNNIKAIPEKAFLGNPLLQTIHFYDNPIQFVGRSAFRYLPRLHTLSLNGATDIQGFPDLKGTTSLEILELSHNQIEGLPSLHGCQKLEEIGLQHNRIWEIRADTFRQLTSLQALDLSWNAIRSIHPEAFVTLRSLVKLCSPACRGWVLTQGAGTPALTALLSGLQATPSPLLPARSLCSRHIGRMGVFIPLKDEATEARADLRRASASRGAGDGARFPDVQPGPFPRRRPVAALSGLEAWLLLIFLQGGHAHLHLWLLSWPGNRTGDRTPACGQTAALFSPRSGLRVLRRAGGRGPAQQADALVGRTGPPVGLRRGPAAVAERLCYPGGGTAWRHLQQPRVVGPRGPTSGGRRSPGSPAASTRHPCSFLPSLPSLLSSGSHPGHTGHAVSTVCLQPPPRLPVTLTIHCPRDLTDNQLTALPLAGLGGLVHLKLKGNWALSQAFPKDSFPKLRTLEVPYAYQCCSYGVCARFFQALGRRAPHGPHPDDRDTPKTPLGLLAGPAESRCPGDEGGAGLDGRHASRLPSPPWPPGRSPGRGSRDSPVLVGLVGRSASTAPPRPAARAPRRAFSEQTAFSNQPEPGGVRRSQLS